MEPLGIPKQTYRLWIEHIESGKQNKYMFSASSLRTVLKNGCLSAPHKSCALISSSSNKGVRKLTKVRQKDNLSCRPMLKFS